MATETKGSVGKVKSINQDGSSKAKIDVNKKKIDSSGKQKPSDSKQNRSVSTVTKTEIKSKPSSSSSKTTVAKTIVATTNKVRQKKVFTLPGQKFDPPEEREPLRIFYESLSEQIPSSEMAEFWMMEHGLLSPDRAKKAYEKKQRKQKQQRMGTPVKPSKSLISSKPESSQRQQQASKNGDVKAKKRLSNDSDDDDFIFSPKRRKG